MISVEGKRKVRDSRNVLDRLKGLEKVLEVSRPVGAFKISNWNDCLD